MKTRILSALFCLAAMTGAAHAVRPAIATIEGRGYDLVYNRRDWTITGAAAGRKVDVRIDHDNKKIFSRGESSLPVNLTFQWSEKRVVMEGTANFKPVKLDIDWTKGTVTGTLNLRFNLQEGKLRDLNDPRSNFNADYDQVSGMLSPTGIRLQNMDLSDYIQLLYLFL